MRTHREDRSPAASLATPVLHDLLYLFTSVYLFIRCATRSTFLHCFTFRDLPGLPQLLHGDVLIFTMQVAVFISLLLLHVFYYELETEKNPSHAALQCLKMSLFQCVYVHVGL